MHLLAEGFVFGGDDRCFLKEGVKTYLMAPISPLQLANFCLHIYSLWSQVREIRTVEKCCESIQGYYAKDICEVDGQTGGS
jgi:hypothetical protein